MPDDSTATPTTSTGYPDIGSALPMELEQARKRSATIGLLGAGLAILAGRRQRGESALQPIARGAMVGLDQYSDSLKTAAQTLFEQQKAILDQRKTDIAEQRAETADTRAQNLAEHQSEQDRLTEEARDEQRRRDEKNEGLMQDLRDVQHQQADTAESRAEKADKAEGLRQDQWDYENKASGVDPFAHYRDSMTDPKAKEYLDTFLDPETTKMMSRKQQDAEMIKFRQNFAKDIGFGKSASAGGKGKNQTYQTQLVWPPGSKTARPYDVVVDPDGNPIDIKRKAGVDYPNVGSGILGGGYKDVPPLSVFGGKKFRSSSAAPSWDTHRVDLTAHPVGSTIDLGNGKTGIVTADGRIAKPNSGAAGRSGEGTATRAPSSPGRGTPTLYRDASGVPFKDPKGNYLYQGTDGYYVGPDMTGKNLKPYAAPAA